MPLPRVDFLSERELQLLLSGSPQHEESGRALSPQSRTHFLLSPPSSGVLVFAAALALRPPPPALGPPPPALGRGAQPSGTGLEKATSLAISKSCPPGPCIGIRNELRVHWLGFLWGMPYCHQLLYLCGKPLGDLGQDGLGAEDLAGVTLQGVTATSVH